MGCQLILCCMRGGEEAANRETVAVAAHFLGKGVCAVDLAGAEALYPTQEYQPLFAYAQSLGVPFTLHAGRPPARRASGRPWSWAPPHWPRCPGRGGPSPGGGACPPPRPPGALPHQQPANKGRAGLGPLPLKEYLAQGVAATVNTDNMTVSRTTLAQEFASLRLAPQERRAVLLHSVEAAFLPPAQKAALRQAVEAALAH